LQALHHDVFVVQAGKAIKHQPDNRAGFGTEEDFTVAELLNRITDWPMEDPGA